MTVYDAKYSLPQRTEYRDQFPMFQIGGDCSDGAISDGYKDLRSGAKVTVKDGGGKTIGLGELGPGKIVASACKFTFTVLNIPAADFYEVEVGRRGSLTFSHDEMEKNEWKVAFSLGNP